MKSESSETLVYDSRIAVPYAWSAGTALSRFLKALRDDKKILASRCPSCSKTYCLPRRSCGTCFVEMTEWREVGPHGKLLSFTQALYDSKAHPVPRPLIGLIQLDGADTALLHRLADVHLAELKPGLIVSAVFSENRTGSIKDIAYFRPVR